VCVQKKGFYQRLDFSVSAKPIQLLVGEVEGKQLEVTFSCCTGCELCLNSAERSSLSQTRKRLGCFVCAHL